jgi:hypothetical protein
MSAMPLKRTHTAGIDCSIYEEHPKWIISVKYHLKGQPPSATLIVREATLDEAKGIAEDAVKQTGHVCDAACKDWEVI